MRNIYFINFTWYRYVELFIERILNKKNPFKGDIITIIILLKIKFSKTTTITLIIILSTFKFSGIQFGRTTNYIN